MPKILPAAFMAELSDCPHGRSRSQGVEAAKALDRCLPVLSGNPPPSDPAAVEQARESWINDGVSLAIAVARQLCAFPVRRQRTRPILVADHRPAGASPSFTSTCPRRGAESRPDRPSGLGRTACGSTRHDDNPAASLGHFGMMSTARAPNVVRTPIANWLRLGSAKR